MLIPKTVRQTGRSRPEKFRSDAPVDVVRIKVSLIEIVPPVWRRLTVPINLTLRRLHFVLQQAMGWQDVQPHRFRVGETLFGKPEDSSGGLKDSRWITIQDLVSVSTKKFHYEYGPGARWVHEVRIEGLGAGTPANQLPTCLSGERACPPEESRGPDDYVDRILAARASYDPEQFDVEQVNAALAALKL